MYSRGPIGYTALLLLLATGTCIALEDPMQPPGSSAMHSSAAAGGAGFVLSSTLIAHDRKAAVINGKRLVIGDSIGGARVVEILPTRVHLIYQGRPLTVNLLPVAVKTPAKFE